MCNMGVTLAEFLLKVWVCAQQLLRTFLATVAINVRLGEPSWRPLPDPRSRAVRPSEWANNNKNTAGEAENVNRKPAASPQTISSDGDPDRAGGCRALSAEAQGRLVCVCVCVCIGNTSTKRHTYTYFPTRDLQKAKHSHTHAHTHWRLIPAEGAIAAAFRQQLHVFLGGFMKECTATDTHYGSNQNRLLCLQ